MKKRYSLRTNRRLQVPIALRIGVLVGAAVVGMLLLVRVVAPGAITTLITPLWVAGNSMSTWVGTAFSFTSTSSLEVDRSQAQAEVVALTARNALLSARVADLERLTGAAGQPPGIAASVLVRPPVSPYDILVIDRGGNDNITSGMLVLGPGGTPVGNVSEVSPSRSRVLLYSAVGVATTGWVGDQRVPVTLMGRGAGAFSATVPREAGVVVGSGVYVAAAGAAPIGSVVSIDADPSSPTVLLQVRPYTNPFSLTWVSVLMQ